jgi:hypothetical protein
MNKGRGRKSKMNKKGINTDGLETNWKEPQRRQEGVY